MQWGFFFFLSGYICTLRFGILQLLAMEAYTSSVPPSCWDKTEEEDVPFFNAKDIFTCADWKGGHSLCQEVHQFEQAGNEKMFHRLHISNDANVDSKHYIGV